MRGDRELVVRFVREKHAFDNGPDRPRSIVGEGTEVPAGKPVVLRGDAGEGELKPGLTYRFFGHTKVHPRYGEQFAFSGFCLDEPADPEGLAAYLQQVGGLGPGTAKAIVSKWGQDGLRMLREEPSFVVANIPGKFRLTEEKAKAAGQELARTLKTERTKVEMLALLRGRGFPKKVVDQAIREWGPRAARVIKHNPFALLRFSGCGFLNTDRMYGDLRLPPARLRRQLHCLEHGLASDGDGSTWLPFAAAERHLRRLVSGAAVATGRAIELGVRAERLAIADHAGSIYVAEQEKAVWEHAIADHALAAAAGPIREGKPVAWPDAFALDGLSEHQQAESAKATAGRIGVLRGSPGTGKTFALAELIKAIVAKYGLMSVAAAAPTGKAAVRMTESLANAGVALPASTIHRLLGVQPAGEGFGFVHNTLNPLPFKFLVIDESSMLDTTLTGQLLAACGPETHILFVGDPYQLPPVGHGKPFLDLSTRVPCGELTEIRRNSGRIVQACAAIRDRQAWEPTPGIVFDLEAGENLVTTGHSNAEAQIDWLEVTLNRFRNPNDNAAAWNYDAIWDVQVLVAVNQKSPLARGPLNRRLQALLNPEGETVPGHPFRVGDKVVCLKNGWYQALVGTADLPDAEKEAVVDNDRGELLVANGELGEVLSVEPTRTVVRMLSPERTILVPHKQMKSGEKGDGDAGEGEGGAISNWDLGYALSCHKSQGSEWPVVIVMLDGSGAGQRVTSRNWLYTAISRAKGHCLVIGRNADAAAACRRDGLSHRRTLLPALLAGEPVTYLRGDELRRRLAERAVPQLVAVPVDDETEDEPQPIRLTDDDLESLFAPRAAAAAV